MCDIDGCNEVGIVHIAGYPDCLDLCQPHATASQAHEDEFTRTQRVAGCCCGEPE